MYKAPSKKQELVQRIMVYSAMTATVLLFVTVAIFLTLGYRFNRDSNSLQQGGLVQFISRPSGADITLGSAKLSARTPDKVTANPGNYTVKMARDGYKTWSKNIMVRSGQVLWLNYAQLVPNEIATTTVRQYDTLASVVASPDNTYLAVLENAGQPTVSLVDTSSTDLNTESISAPVSVLTPVATSRLSIVRWSTDGDKLLLRHIKGTQTEYAVLDLENPEDSYNLTRQFKLAVSEAQFDPRSSNRLFVRTKDGDVRLVNIDEGTASAVLLSDVTKMTPYEDQALVYVQASAKNEQKVGYLTFGETTPRVVATLPTSQTIHVAAAKYFGDAYVAIAAGTELTIQMASRLPNSAGQDTLPFTVIQDMQLTAPVRQLTMHSRGRFVVVQHDKAMTNYDLELARHVVTSFATKQTRELGWLDMYHVYFETKGSIEVMEFDGGNKYTLANGTAMFDAVQTSDGKYIYSFAATKDGYELQRSRMIVD